MNKVKEKKKNKALTGLEGGNSKNIGISALTKQQQIQYNFTSDGLRRV